MAVELPASLPDITHSLPTSLHDKTNHKAVKRELKTNFQTSIVYNRILTISLLYVMRHWSRYSVNGALEITFMNYERDVTFEVY